MRYVTSSIKCPDYLHNARGIVSQAKGYIDMGALCNPCPESDRAQDEIYRAYTMIHPEEGDYNDISREVAREAVAIAREAKDSMTAIVVASKAKSAA